MTFSYTIKADDDGRSVLDILIKKFDFSRKLIIKLKKTEHGIKLNGNRAFTNRIVENNDLLTIHLEFDEESVNVTPEEVPVDILYEDEALIAVNKQAGMVVHPTHNYQKGTLSNGVARHYISHGIKTKIRPVSRLDRGTSGIVIFAKNQFVQERLSGNKSDLKFTKAYIALVNGHFQPLSGTIDMPINRLAGSTIERVVSSSGSRAVTHYNSIELYKDYSLVEFTLETGRTHQIRVHCKYSGHPIVGDTLYYINGLNNNLGMEHQALHSYKTSFIHPVTFRNTEIRCELPKDFSNAVNLFRA